MLSWHALPDELQLLIVIELAGSFDTIHELYNLFLVSKSLHDRLVGAPSRGITENNSLYFLLFKSMYDDQAVKRRLKIQLTPAIYAKELKYRCQLLKRIRSGSWKSLNSEELLRGLWHIYLMLLDDDGNNLRQLQVAGVKQFLLDQVLMRLQDDLEDGWPKETIYLQLSAASFAIMSDRADVLHEPPEVTEHIYNCLEQIYVASHRYPHTHIPMTVFYRYHLLHIPTVQPGSLRTIATLPSFPPSSVVYFNQQFSLAPPSLACSAALVLTNRRERRALGLLPNRPLADQEMSRFRAMAIGVEVPPAGSGRENLSVLLDPLFGSRRWDHAFARMRAVADLMSANPRNSVDTWFKSMYYPGMYSGKWLGRILLPDVRFMVQMTNMHPAPFAQVRDSVDEDLQHIWDLNFYAELREHLACDEVVGCGLDGVDAGYRNGYFPDGVDPVAGHNFTEQNDRVSIIDPNEPDTEFQTKHYQTLNEKFPEHHLRSPIPLSVASSPTQSVDIDICVDDYNSISDGVMTEFDQAGVGINEDTIDVIITGETDGMHGDAWNHFRFYGRIRKLDGLLVIVRVCPSDPDQGRWVFAGNMHLANTIVGLCRQSHTDIGVTSLQGPFVISKIGKDF
ncbi:hypothetical protein Clacol_007405 [Clathrus columnatus]|uniref:F-box domain-containing protein n=1 Tax=Clathrus columnatus TaxID=1419009 RepID=A0AAV5AEU5_9AGAM|nr:hypothetical protein Clacol_007405 [Clathrus columnatus]